MSDVDAKDTGPDKDKNQDVLNQVMQTECANEEE